MPASLLRLEGIALFSYLKNEVLPVHFSEWAYNEALVYSSTLVSYVPESTLVPHPTSKGRGWVFFDEATVNGSTVIDATSEQTTRVSVTGASSYTIDYFRGAIKNPNTIPTEISYTYNYISVIDGWPGEDVPPLPVISIDLNKMSKQGLQIGGGKRNIRELYIEIFAQSNPERDDITEILYDSLFTRNIAVKDFSTGFYLKPDGTYNTGFVPTTGGYIYVTDVQARTINNKTDLSLTNRHRSVITLQYETITEI